jgi:hypothetical protein
MKGFIAWFSTLPRSVFRAVLRKDDDIQLSTPKTALKTDFRRGDRVIDRDKHKGKIIKCYRSIKDNELKAVSILWDKPKDGEKLTLLVPISELTKLPS